MKRNILLTPGPITTTEAVKKKLLMPDMCPRVREFEKLIKVIRMDLIELAGGDGQYTTTLFTGSGTAAMESVVCSALPKLEWTLIISNGHYGKRFISMAKAHRIRYIGVNFENAINVDTVRDILSKHKHISSIIVVHHETTTGILNPIKEIGELAKEFECIYVVDAISSFGGIPIPLRECNIDYLVGTANKCIQGLPGISFVISNLSKLNKLKDLRMSSVYLDLYSNYYHQETTNQMKYTAPVQMMYAFKQAIDELKDEGIDDRNKRYTKNMSILVKYMEELGFEQYLRDDVVHSNILETFYTPPKMDYNKINDTLIKNGYTIYPGKLTDKDTFRLSTIGDIHENDIHSFIDVFKGLL